MTPAEISRSIAGKVEPVEAGTREIFAVLSGWIPTTVKPVSCLAVASVLLAAAIGGDRGTVGRIPPLPVATIPIP